MNFVVNWNLKEFEELEERLKKQGREMSPLEVMIASESYRGTADHIRRSKDNRKKPEAHSLWNEFLLTIMLTERWKQEMNDDKQ